MKRALVVLGCLIPMLLFASCGGGTTYGIKEFAAVMEKANTDLKNVKNSDELAALTTRVKNDILSLQPKLLKLKEDYPGFFSQKPDVTNLPKGVSGEDLTKLMTELDLFNAESNSMPPEWSNDPVVQQAVAEFRKVYGNIF